MEKRLEKDTQDLWRKWEITRNILRLAFWRGRQVSGHTCVYMEGNSIYSVSWAAVDIKNRHFLWAGLVQKMAPFFLATKGAGLYAIRRTLAATSRGWKEEQKVNGNVLRSRLIHASLAICLKVFASFNVYYHTQRYIFSYIPSAVFDMSKRGIWNVVRMHIFLSPL